jgi:hypothetical protein
MTATEWNPYYVAFARSNGRTPEEQVKADLIVYDDGGPDGARMDQFMRWTNERWHEWMKQTGKDTPGYIKSEQDHADFGRWLAVRP